MRPTTKRILGLAALVGAAIPIVIVIVGYFVNDPRLESYTLMVWPTWFFLLPFSGPPTLFTLGVFTITVLLNAAIYALLAFACLTLFRKVRA